MEYDIRPPAADNAGLCRMVTPRLAIRTPGKMLNAVFLQRLGEIGPRSWPAGC